jgi:CubicO group peptidase (beta-lactamase class C family)
LSNPVDAIFKDMTKNTPGAAVLVMRDGAEVYKRSFGLASIPGRVPISFDTRFRLASLSKPFTAMAIMILVRRDLLDYDDPLSEFYPDMRFPEGSGRITVRTLLRHLSGLPEYEAMFEDDPRASKWPDWPRSVEPPNVPPDAFQPDSKDVVEILSRQKQLVSPVGAIYSYSNTGYVVLGRIIETVTGKSYGEFLSEAIFKPLGMDETLVSDGNVPRVPKRATSYKKEEGRYHEIDYSPLNRVFGDDGVYSTINDMKKWLDGLDRGLDWRGSPPASLLPGQAQHRGADRLRFRMDHREEMESPAHLAQRGVDRFPDVHRPLLWSEAGHRAIDELPGNRRREPGREDCQGLLVTPRHRARSPTPRMRGLPPEARRPGQRRLHRPSSAAAALERLLIPHRTEPVGISDRTEIQRGQGRRPGDDRQALPGDAPSSSSGGPGGAPRVRSRSRRIGPGAIAGRRAAEPGAGIPARAGMVSPVVADRDIVEGEIGRHPLIEQGIDGAERHLQRLVDASD